MKADQTDEDATLMAAFVRTRDRAMFETIFQRYRRPIVAHAARFVRDRGRAEEIAQEVFVRVYTTKTYEPNAKFKTWLYRVATNVCLNEMRRPEEKRRSEPLDAAVDREASPELGLLSGRSGTPEEHASGRELKERIERTLMHLPENQRAAFLMARQDSMTHEEIAEVLSTSVSAVKSLIHRALETLRKEVRDLMADHESSTREALR